ncbi:TULIP family P47-like protein [Peribacillus muralis]|uniref:TULIP family P47-like protein n=1 Tax=Peribacillus muralis TaxID=264697 RepID=UPI003CFF1AF6
MNIYGWDMVYICSNMATNKYLKKYMSDNEITFSYADTNTNTRINLVFDGWEIIRGGSSKLLRIKTPVKKGEIEINGSKRDISGICPVLEVQLNFFNQSVISKLAFNFLVEGKNVGDTTDGAVTIINVDSNNKFPGDIVNLFLELLLPATFIANKNQISFVFAELNLAPNETWMQPKKYKYAYIAPTGGNNDGYLAVCSVVTNRDIVQLSPTVDTKMLDNENDTYLMLSERLFLENIIMPELPSTFGNGALPSYFGVQEDPKTGLAIINTRTLDLSPVRSGSTDYYPKLSELNMKVESNKIVVTNRGWCDVGFGAYVDFDTKAINQFYYDKNHNNGSFIADSNPTSNYQKHIPWYVWAILGIGLVFGAIIVAIIHEVISKVTNSVTQNVRLGSNEYLTKIQTSSLTWNGMKETNTTDALLDVAFCIKGKAT